MPAQATIACGPGIVYSITQQGQLQETRGGNVTNVGFSLGSDTFNGLGIGTGGSSIYAYTRNDGRVPTIYKFNTSTDRWETTGVTYDTSRDGYSGQLTTGAVDLSSQNGTYYFGGLTNAGSDGFIGKEFKLWRYNPTTKAVSFVGTIDTSQGASRSAPNGDIAFDSQGNLFIVRGVGSTATVFSVTNDALAAARGGNIQASASGSIQTSNANVNGIAFDANGKVYLGGANEIWSYDMPQFTTPSRFSTAGGTTDLASCSSPATITLEKDVRGRVNSGDQFGLSLNQGANNLGGNVTAGSDTGVQDEVVGPFPVVRGNDITFSETASGTTDLSKYATSYQCTAGGQPISGASGNGRSATVRIPPSGGGEIVCRFTNTPLTANVTINKKTQNTSGGNEQNASGWTVGATTSATTGTANQAPINTTQTTDSAGNAKWTITFGSLSSRANLSVSETQQSGFAFFSGTCRITRLDGTTANVTLNGANSQTLSSAIQPGDQVDCSYINRQQAADVTVNKNWVIDGRTVADGQQPGGMSAKLLLDPAGQPAGDPAFGQKRTGFAVNDTVRIGETTTFDERAVPGCSVKTRTISGPGITGTVPLTDNFSTRLPGASNTYTVTNTVECQTLTITKQVDNDNGGTLTAADWNQKLCATPNGGSRLTFDSGEKKYVAAGSFVISEDTLAGYDQESITCTGGTYNEATKTVSIAAGQNANCTVTNADSSGTVSWEKVNASGDSLDGSEWTLRGPDGTEVDITDCVAASADACDGPDQDPAAGKFLIKGLKWGDYAVVETRAPAGYVLDETEHDFSITRERLDHQFDAPFVNKQADSPQLPMTGGTGTIGYVIGGVVLLLACVAGAIWHNRRRALGRS
ncbi:SpaA isopeptide-forming pilin-related protein [Brevibacterium sp. 2SA]|uniref:SpaA isopeptide-forming pilin-related protein n=1 Tax=Brevibacterium sp. 2SA TaxID=2502198 RepID=UPI00148581F8|nr:SpaA isopeptide-forming pilin-related protein [Brevibacterium sp. 2SA]